MWDEDELIGRFFLDMHPRENKYQHAAAFPFQLGITGVQTPVSGLVCNFPRGGEPMEHSQVTTFLHEFGHLIHTLFAGNHHWYEVSGINTEWDFVEAPSQMLQEWVWDYDTIATFARNAEGEVIPRELLNKMITARDFGLGMGTRRQLSLAAMSMGIYDRNPEGLDLKEFTDNISREYILEPGGAKPAAELVTDFLGRDISFKPYADRLSGAGLPATDTD